MVDILPGFSLPAGVSEANFPRTRENWQKSSESFPIDMSGYKRLSIDLNQESLTETQLAQLRTNIELTRDAIVLFTAVAGAKGLGGHTGGAYDMMPEMLIADGLINGNEEHGNNLHPVILDAAGHRVAAHYLMAAINGDISFGDLLHYREAGMGLAGHPEPERTPGINFAGGRLGHQLSFANGIAAQDLERRIIVMDTDGSQQEGLCAEAWRHAVQQKHGITSLVDYNHATISGDPAGYLSTFDLAKTLRGQGVMTAKKENAEGSLESLYTAIRSTIRQNGPSALLCERPIAPGIEDVEGDPGKGHDVISAEAAIKYFEKKGNTAAVEMINAAKEQKSIHTYCELKESGATLVKNRDHFGVVVSNILDELGPENAKKSVRVYDADLAGSCGLHHIKTRHPDVFVQGGIMEAHHMAAAAGFGSEEGKQGIFGTFAAFQEMGISQIKMASIAGYRALFHFSHSGIGDMADNDCHLGINNFFADNDFAENNRIKMYMPADAHQLEAVVRETWKDDTMRFVYSTRSATGVIKAENGKDFFSKDAGYEIRRDDQGNIRDDVVREGQDGYIVSYGDMLYSAVKVSEKLKANGHDIGVISKNTLNTWDEQTMEKLAGSNYVMVIESQNESNALGSRLGTELLKRKSASSPLVYDNIGVSKSGIGGLRYAQMRNQGLDIESLYERAETKLAA